MAGELWRGFSDALSPQSFHIQEGINIPIRPEDSLTLQKNMSSTLMTIWQWNKYVQYM